MCSPVLAVTIGASLFQAVTQAQQASAQAKSANATAINNQRVAEYNAKVQDQNAVYQDKAAVDAENRGANEAATAREQYKKANATARAIAAGEGLLTNTGTFGDIQDQNTTTGEVNALTVSNNAEREAYGFKVKGNDFRSEATNLRLGGQVGVNNARYAGAVTRQNGLLDAASTLVTGASSAYNTYNTNKILAGKK